MMQIQNELLMKVIFFGNIRYSCNRGCVNYKMSDKTRKVSFLKWHRFNKMVPILRLNFAGLRLT